MDKKPFDGPPSSADLILRAQRGDQSALSALFSRHMPMLQRWAHGKLPRWARAFDLERLGGEIVRGDHQPPALVPAFL